MASGGRPLLTVDLLEHSYPRVDRYRRWHYVSIYRAASKFAVRVGRQGELDHLGAKTRGLTQTVDMFPRMV